MRSQPSSRNTLKSLRSGLRIGLIACAILFTLLSLPIAFVAGGIGACFRDYELRYERHRAVVDSVNAQQGLPFRIKYNRGSSGILSIDEWQMAEEHKQKQQAAIGKAYAEVIYKELTTQP